MAKERIGLIHVYTGEGKGKTSAAMGLALRAVGQGMKVFIIQFMKGGYYTGEFIAGKNFLPNIELMQYGKECIKEQKQIKLQDFDDIDNADSAAGEFQDEKNRFKPGDSYRFFDFIREEIDCRDCRHCFVNDEEQVRFIKDAIDKANKIISSGEYDLVILDEINIAVNLGFIKTEEVLELIGKKASKTELVLTGRYAPKEFLEKADYASEIKMIKHPFEKGIGARRGIEY